MPAHIDLKGNSVHHFNFFKKRFNYELKAPDHVILELGNYDLKTRDLILLLRKNWLNDMIINYFGLILSNETFRGVAQKIFPEDNLYRKNFVILNTFVSVNVGYLEKAYLEYKKMKIGDQRSESSGASETEEGTREVFYSSAKQTYLE